MSNLTGPKEYEWLAIYPRLRLVSYHKILNELSNENTKLKTDCKTLAQKLLQVKPELREWLEVNFKEYL